MSFDPLRSEKNVSTTDHQSPSSGPSPAPRKRRVWLWVLGLLFGGGFLCLLICCGVGAYVVQNHGSALFEPARAELNQLADLREEVGTIETLTINFSESIDEAKANPEFFILKGSSETGPVELSIKMSNAGKLEKVFLVLPDGSRKPIDLEQRVGGTTATPQPQGDRVGPAEEATTPDRPSQEEEALET